MSSITNSRKIIFKIPEFPHVSETFIVAQIQTALKLGYDVDILTKKLISHNLHLIDKLNLSSKIIIEEYQIPKNRIVRVLKWLTLLIFNVKHIGYIIKYYNAHQNFSLTWLYEFLFYSKMNTVNIVHVQYGTSKYPLDILKAIGFFKPELIVSFHGHDAFFPINGFIKNEGYYYNLFKNSFAIIGNTNFLGKALLDLGCLKQKLQIIPVGINTDFFKLKTYATKSNAPLRLITVGRLHRIKGQLHAIKAIKTLKEKQYNVSFTIVGEGSEYPVLDKFIKDHNLQDCVNLVGKKTALEIKTLFNNHDVYILTAITLPDGRQETQGLATIEAQSCGLPVVAFDTGGVKYTLVDKVTGFLCEEGDYLDLQEKLVYFINNPSHIKSMGIEASKFVEKTFNNRVLSKDWERIYASAYNKNIE